MEVEFEAVLYFALKLVLFTNTVVANIKDGASLSTEKPARYCTQLPCLSVFCLPYIFVFTLSKASSLTQKLSCSESPSKVMSSGQLANQDGEKDWEHASLPEYTGKELIVDFKINFHV